MKRRRTLTPETVERLTLTVGPWLSCDACFDQVDTVVDDLLILNIPMQARFRAHLQSCPACRDETRALIELAATDDGIDPTAPLAHFDASVTSSRR